MTKLRDPCTFEHAVTRVAGRIGWAAAAEAVGKVERVVRNWSDPDMDRMPTIAEALALDAAYLAKGGGEPPMLAAYQAMLERSIAHPADAEDLAVAGAVAAREAGEAISALFSVARPGATAVDRAHTAKELDEAIESLTDARAKLGVAPPHLKAV